MKTFSCQKVATAQKACLLGLQNSTRPEDICRVVVVYSHLELIHHRPLDVSVYAVVDIANIGAAQCHLLQSLIFSDLIHCDIPPKIPHCVRVYAIYTFIFCITKKPS